MSRGKVAVLVAAGALATTGTALAASGGGPAGDVYGGGQDEFAKDLAGELGVSQSKVETALQDVADQQQAERTRDFAGSLAAQLDGVSVDDIVSILDEQQQKLSEEMKSGPPAAPKADQRANPEDGPLVAALAEGLGKSKSEIAAALDAAGKAEAATHRKEMLDQLDQAVSDGKLSEAQAEQIRKQIESGPPSGGPGGPGGRPPLGGSALGGMPRLGGVPGPGAPGGPGGF